MQTPAHDPVLSKERLRLAAALARYIAHDLSNALFPIRSNTEKLLKHPEHLNHPEKIKQAISAMDRGSQKIGELVDQLYAFYRIRQDMDLFKQIDLNLFVKNLASTNPHKNIELKIYLDSEKAWIKGDGNELKIAFFHLLENAAEAMPKGGKIILEAAKENHWINLLIQDTGLGMSPEVSQKCFIPFFTTKSKGRGFGLTLVKDIIERHGGSIKVKSKSGEGTTFILSFPLL